ncbi:prolyl oligopeptidase family serine peptidase [Peribacillus sp. SCS-155]|uniref:S9 family peptidase n=1 Tax=Peribacillus sedimenti TaxID=3115297 RepID=UPI00390597BE
MGTQGILAEDLFKLKSVTDPQLSPDGKMAVFVQTEIDEKTEKYYSNLYVYDFSAKTLKQWTYGQHRHSSPRWSPDGQFLAFLSNRSGKNQLYIMSVLGGEAKQLTDLENGATKPIWSPGSDKILSSSFVTAGGSLLDTKKEKNDKNDIKTAKIYDRIKYKWDGRGYFDNKHQHLFTVDIESEEIDILAEGELDYTPCSWSPDGKQITYSTDESEDRDYNLLSDVFILDIESKKSKKITSSTGFFGDAEWSPDGKYISMVGHEKEYLGATLSKIWLYDTSSGDTTCLTKDWDVQIGDVAIGDFQIGTVDPGLLWTNDSQGFYFLISDHGNTGVYYGTVEGAMYPSLLEKQHVYGLTINAETHEAVVAVSTPTQPGDLHSINLSTGEKEQLTFVNDSFLAEKTLSKAEPLSFKANDGLEIHGWIMKPVGYEEGKKYPLILEIHGGPHAMYANSYFHEFQTLAASGYTVLFTNPRGSHGYGQEFVNAVRGDYGGKDYEDLMSAVDYALGQYDFIDPEKLGVTGGSYGGFMTNWIVGHTDRFKAAVTQRCISNWISFYGVSDIGYFFTDWEVGGDVLESAEKLWQHSPLKYAGNVTTPLLLLHGELDYRCPIEQAEQFYVALKRQKKEAVLVSFPGENHEVSRSGAPRLKLQHVEHIRDWFNKYV